MIFSWYWQHLLYGLGYFFAIKNLRSLHERILSYFIVFLKTKFVCFFCFVYDDLFLPLH
jgi:hypothetical protein